MVKKVRKKKVVKKKAAKKVRKQKTGIMKNGGSGKEQKYDFTSVKQKIEENLELELGPTSLRAVEYAYELARQVSIERPILTTSDLFFGMVDCGKQEEMWNSAKFLFERVGKIVRKIKESYLINAKRNIKARQYPNTAEVNSVTDYVFRTIEKAGQAARETTGGNKVSARHLLAGIILYRPEEPETGAWKRLKQMGVKEEQLERDFLDFLIKANLKDNYEAWKKLLGGEEVTVKPISKTEQTKAYRVPIASFSGDGVRDAQGRLIDRLGIEDEVEGMSKLVAVKDVKWPLSIGLFGRWGSGKTFFMEMMEDRIREITQSSAEGIRKGKNSVFCRNVVQIKFNAWHFMDANLWASLVTHIFDELARQISTDEEKDVQKKKELLFANVESAKRLLKEAEGKYQDAHELLKTAKAKKNRLEKERNTVDDELKKLKVRDVVSLAKNDPEVLEKLARVAENLGLESFSGMEPLREVVHQSHAVFGKLALIWKNTASGKKGKLRLLIFTALLVGLPVVIALLLLLVIPSEWGSRLSSIAGAGLTFLVGWAKILTPRLKQISEALNRWEQIQDEIQGVISQKTHERTEEEMRLLREIERLRELERAAREELERASKREQEAEEDVKEVKTGRRLYKFIEERSSRREYKDKLGIIALIREDFEGLSKLIRESADDNSVDELRRIDRIVLYIDDLDRCPADRVVEVLQAVHLILGFELFVVIVGVDPRWILHALREEYTAFGGVEGKMDSVSRRWLTTPQDYVEKIFQIPFSVRPMGQIGYEKLVSQLVEPNKDKTREDYGGRTPINTATSSKTFDARGNRQITSVNVKAGPKQAAGSPGKLPGKRKSPVSISQQQQGGTKSGKIEFDLSPPAMELKEGEIEFMKAMGDLIPSPRATKRFVNIYRLILATLTSQEKEDQFKGKGGRPGDYEAVLLMLGILTRFPGQACDILRYLARNSDESELFSTFVKRLKPKKKPETEPVSYSNNVVEDISEQERPSWEALYNILNEKATKLTEKTLGPFTRWAGWVGRFSFQYGRVVTDIQPGMGNLSCELSQETRDLSD